MKQNALLTSTTHKHYLYALTYTPVNTYELTHTNSHTDTHKILPRGSLVRLRLIIFPP